MNSIDIFLWGVAPYLSFAILILATILRRVYFARTWTAKSSEFLEKRHERIATPAFHIAILFIVLGHIGGLLIPQAFTDSLGLSEQQYHSAAFLLGGIAGTALVVFTIMLITRRFGSNKRLRKNTSTADRVLYIVLALTIIAGMAATLSNADGAFNYRQSLAPWIRGIFVLQPNPQLMIGVPLLFKIHMMCWMILFAILPFTRLVHIFSGIRVPFSYLGRSAIIYRRRKRANAFSNKATSFSSSPLTPAVYNNDRSLTQHATGHDTPNCLH